MTNTHPQFRSIVDNIQSTDDIYDAVGIILVHQRKFQKRFPPWESDEWSEEDAEEFMIRLDQIDRLYHVKCQKVGDGMEYELVARMDYGDRPLYLHVRVYTTYAWDGVIGEGETYLTFDPQVFLKSIINCECNPRRIWQSMFEDGLQVDEASEFDLQQSDAWRSVPMLKFLCHMTVYQRQEELKEYLEVLPTPLVRSVEEFLRIRQSRDHRDGPFVSYPDYFGVYLSSSLAPP